MSESALIVKVPEAEPVVGRLRDRFDPVARLGVPAHVTILYPFMPPEAIDAGILKTLRSLVATVTAFEFRLHATGRFPDTLYLQPDPTRDFIAFTTRIAEVFPDFPPYGGKFSAIAPHLTVARGPAPQLRDLQRELDADPLLMAGLYARCETVTLIENASGSWRDLHKFALSS